MAYRFGGYYWVKEGVLDNTLKGRTSGQIEIAGLGKVVLDLEGDMLGDLHGRRVRFSNPSYDPKFVFDHGDGKTSTAKQYMERFNRKQVGRVGDIYVDHNLYIEWFSKSNWRCVIELDTTRVTAVEKNYTIEQKKAKDLPRKKNKRAPNFC